MTTEIINCVSICISMLALAICLFIGINAIFTDGIKGLEKSKIYIISLFGIYALTFLVFLCTQ